MMKALIVFLALLFQQEEAPEEGKPASCNNYHQTPKRTGVSAARQRTAIALCRIPMSRWIRVARHTAVRRIAGA